MGQHTPYCPIDIHCKWISVNTFCEVYVFMFTNWILTKQIFFDNWQHVTDIEVKLNLTQSIPLTLAVKSNLNTEM